ncbi:MAG: hypothetical protein FWD45_03330 [Coriobacteriia bacterium]|nr:hypothetical protein [Coriobacteriia bacterium]
MTDDSTDGAQPNNLPAEAVEAIAEQEVPDPLVQSAPPQPPQPQTPQSSQLQPTEESVQEQRSKRSRNTLLAVISLVFALALALVWFGFRFLLPVISKPAEPLGPIAELEPNDSYEPGVIPLTITIEKITIPNLTQLFGRTGSEAIALLGSGWEVTKVSDAEPGTADNNTADTSAVQRLVTLTYTPRILSVEGGNFAEGDADYQEIESLLPKANLYLSLNDEGRVIEVYLTADMELFEIENTTFNALLSTENFLSWILADAGINPRNFSYSVPDFNRAISYDYPDSPNRKVMKQSTIFSGRVADDGIPTAWAVTVTYEFIPPIANPSEAESPRRVIHISLS